MEIRAVKPTDLQDLLRFTDAHIGEGYFNKMTILQHINDSRRDGINCSFVIVDDHGEIQGIRLTFPPGHWQPTSPSDITPTLWASPQTQQLLPLTSVGYFKSLFIAPKLQRQGWGSKLSLMSLTALRQLKAKAVVSHSWMQSPGDSSSRYLRSLGFQDVAIHKNYWAPINYTCPRCGKPCRCDAMEMILYL